MRGFQPSMAKRQNYVNGGRVRGPGTGVSDDIEAQVAEGAYIVPADSVETLAADGKARPGSGTSVMSSKGFQPGIAVNLSNGEHALTPEQVSAIGAATLDIVRGATHEPVAGQSGRGFSPGREQLGANGASPRMFFADGGRVTDDEQRSAKSFAPNLGSSGRFATVPPGIGEQPGRSVPDTTSASAPKPRPAATVSPAGPDTQTGMAATGFFPHLGRQAASSSIGAGSSAATPASAPAASVPATEVEGWRTKAVMDGAAEDAQAAWDRGSVAGAAGAVARGAITAIPTSVGEFAYNTVAPLARGFSGFYDGLTGSETSTTPTTVGMTSAASDAPGPRGAQAPAPMEASRSIVTGSSSDTGAVGLQPDRTSPAGGSSGANGAVTRVGNSYSGAPGVSGDITVNGNSPAGGAVSRQNMAAADALAARGFQPAAAAPATASKPSVTVPTVRNSANDWAARKELENLATAASSITNTRRFGGRGFESNPDLVAYRAALANDAAARGADAGAGVEGMRQNAGLQREEMRQAGETQRAGTRGAVEAQRNGIAAQQADTQRRTADSQIEAQGYANRAAAQQEQLRAVLADPGASPQQRAQAQQALRSIAGQGQSDWKVQVTPATKNADGSTSEGSVIRYNQVTGDVQRVEVGQQANQQQFEKGAVYVDGQGRKARFNGTGWEPA